MADAADRGTYSGVMAQATVEDLRKDYWDLFPESKRLARAKLIREAALMAVNSINACIAEKHGIPNAFRSLIDDVRAAGYVSEYVESAITFKIDNGILPKDRIEASKIVAILIANFYQKPFEDLFGFDARFHPDKSAYPRVVRGTFFNRLAYATLGLPGHLVKEGIGPDLHRILTTEDVSNLRVMSVLFKGIFQKYGNEKDCLTD